MHSSFGGALATLAIAFVIGAQNAHGATVFPSPADLALFTSRAAAVARPAQTPLAPPSLNTSCALALIAIAEQQDLALKYALSTPRGPGDLGDFYGCRNIPSAHYCLVADSRFPPVFTATGPCLPDACSALDVQLGFQIVALFLNNLTYGVFPRTFYNTTSVECAKFSVDWDAASTAVLCAFVALASLVLLAGLVEYLVLVNVVEAFPPPPPAAAVAAAPSDETTGPVKAATRAGAAGDRRLGPSAARRRRPGPGLSLNSAADDDEGEDREAEDAAAAGDRVGSGRGYESSSRAYEANNRSGQFRTPLLSDAEASEGKRGVARILLVCSPRVA